MSPLVCALLTITRLGRARCGVASSLLWLFVIMALPAGVQANAPLVLTQDRPQMSAPTRRARTDRKETRSAMNRVLLTGRLTRDPELTPEPPCTATPAGFDKAIMCSSSNSAGKSLAGAGRSAFSVTFSEIRTGGRRTTSPG